MNRFGSPQRQLSTSTGRRKLNTSTSKLSQSPVRNASSATRVGIHLKPSPLKKKSLSPPKRYASPKKVSTVSPIGEATPGKSTSPKDKLNS